MFINKKTKNSLPIQAMNHKDLPKWLKNQDDVTKKQVDSLDFTGIPGELSILTDDKGNISQILFGLSDNEDIYDFASLPDLLPENKDGYYIDTKMSKSRAEEVALGWLLGTYRFDNYKSNKTGKMQELVIPDNANKDDVINAAKAVFMVRDLINTPTNDMSPADLEKAALKLAKEFNAKSCVVTGDDLLKYNYPSIHAVGRASETEPRLIDIVWGNEDAPKVTLIGKGVCFDTGGLNIKPGNGMRNMKKDMGGAAHVLGLAHMIMAAKLNVRLRVLIPAVENSISDNAMRPGDVLDTRKGLTIEVDNTDAEGRLILSDALTLASEDKPDLMIDFATLTGAARVAMGPEIPPFMSNDKKLAQDFMKSGEDTKDLVWELPLHANYLKYLNSEVADYKNSGGAGMAGAITAGLFLQEFIDKKIPWLHIDTFGWNPDKKAGRTVGGEAYGILASFDLIKKKFGK